MPETPMMPVGCKALTAARKIGLRGKVVGVVQLVFCQIGAAAFDQAT
ncbi:MAG: hypothetical protein IPJ90_15290 [Anaerolineaceae bacterium]|nr:hypothetical protein [Anaerolineaceae bacterium]